MFKHILCPIDSSECSIQALKVAAQVAADQKADLTICTVVDPVKAAGMAFGDPVSSAACFDALDEEAKGIASDALNLVKDVAQAKTVDLEGQPTEEIVNYASTNGCDLIVMGSHGRGGISRALVGSVAEGVLRHISIPVMVIHWKRSASSVHRNLAVATATRK